MSVDGKSVENAVWTYPQPVPGAEELEDHVAFYWNRMEHWFEEDEEIFVHPRDPFVRLDILPSRRHVRVTLEGTVLAETDRALFLFETGHPTRYYIPREDVRMEHLTASDTRTRCPYKGEASYFHAQLNGKLHEDIVWSYPAPVREAEPVRGYLCFYNERVESIAVSEPDGSVPRG